MDSPEKDNLVHEYQWKKYFNQEKLSKFNNVNRSRTRRDKSVMTYAGVPTIFNVWPKYNETLGIKELVQSQRKPISNYTQMRSIAKCMNS